MNQEYRYLAHLLSCYIHKTTPSIPKDINWDKMKSLSVIHSVQGILGYMVITHKLSDSLEFLTLMRQWCMGNIAVYAGRNSAMNVLSEHMNRAGIEHILFKGFVLKDYYPVPELRSYGDIDFIIRLKDRAKSHQLMLDLGYQVKNDWEAVYSYLKNNEFYEIHSDIMEVNVSDKADYCGYFKNMWEYTVNTGEYSREFTPEYHFVYLLTHIAKHIYGSGAGIRMYLDLAVFIEHFGNKVNWAYVKEQLEELQLYDFYCTVMTAIKKWFDVDSPIELKEVSEKILEEFFVFTVEGGVYGQVNRERGINALKQKGTDEQTASRTGVVLHRLFPPVESLEKRYTYLQKKHWLLPIAWIHRLFLTRDTWGMHAREAKVIMSIDSEEVQRMRKIYKNIGL